MEPICLHLQPALEDYLFLSFLILTVPPVINQHLLISIYFCLQDLGCTTCCEQEGA